MCLRRRGSSAPPGPGPLDYVFAGHRCNPSMIGVTPRPVRVRSGVPHEYESRKHTHIIAKTTAERIAGSPSKTSRASATGYGSARTSGPHCTRGASTSSMPSLSTKRAGPRGRWGTSIRRTPAGSAPSVDTSTGTTGRRNPRLRAGPAGLRPTRPTTRPTTSPARARPCGQRDGGANPAASRALPPNPAL